MPYCYAGAAVARGISDFPPVSIFEGEMRVVLFLQGHPSFFARDLANEIERLGHRALRINLCAGDALYWIGRPSDIRPWRSTTWGTEATGSKLSRVLPYTCHIFRVTLLLPEAV